MAMFVVSSSLGLQIAFQPLEFEWLNRLETLSLTSTYVTVPATYYASLILLITSTATTLSQFTNSTKRTSPLNHQHHGRQIYHQPHRHRNATTPIIYYQGSLNSTISLNATSAATNTLKRETEKLTKYNT